MKNYRHAILVLFFLLFFQPSNSQTIKSGLYFVQEMQVRIPLIEGFPKLLINLNFGMESVWDIGTLTLTPGGGVVLSGTYVQIGEKSLGAVGGGVYFRNRVGFKLGKNAADAISGDSRMITSTPELSFIKLWGQNEEYAILELASDIGLLYYKEKGNYMFNADFVRFGIRPGGNSFVFIASYPKIGIITKQ